MKGELIGKEAEVFYSGQSFTGTIVDETKNTLSLETVSGPKKIIKQNSRIKIDGKWINGKKLAKRPEDRIK